MNDSEICDCECHDKDSHVMHFMECCDTCEVCGQHIKFSYFESHLKKCKDEQKKLLARLTPEKPGVG
jgi:hypothetical protein